MPPDAMDSELAHLRTILATVAEGLRDVADGLTDLDKRLAVSDAKADVRATDLADVRRAVDDIAVKLAPVSSFFDAQNRSAAEAAANRSNLMAYVTKERIALIVAIVAGALSWFRPDMSLSVSSSIPTHTEPDQGTEDDG